MVYTVAVVTSALHLMTVLLICIYMLIVHPVAHRMQRGVEQYCHVTSSISCAIIGASLSEPHLVETIISLSVYTFKIEKHLKKRDAAAKKSRYKRSRDTDIIFSW